IAKLRNSRLTRPLPMKSLISSGKPSCARRAQCGHDSEPYSISFSGASGLPMTYPPSGVSETLSVQFVPAGAAIGAIASPLGASGVSPVPPQAASARASGAAHRVKAKRCKVDIGRIPFRIWRRLDDGGGALKRGPPVSTVAAHGAHELLWR